MMSQVIAGIYEIQNQVGSGGGGIVYLGQHLRLKKKIVIKEDKRTLNTRADLLRREVDMLKDLSHTYIPQVYDFVQENNAVYTVMDFIEGESLDKFLERGEIAPQPQVIAWACQLLEALHYLHSQPPYGILHGDIKPANIMLRPNGNICLIDYNIALALGEDGAVKVGFSQGYASPEHYGIEYCSDRNRKRRRLEKNIEKPMENQAASHTSGKRVTRLVNLSGGSPISPLSTGSSGQHLVTLDVRSDIYSLGATLYHLISGRHPADDAEEVIPLGSDVCRPEVSKIIQKAMQPDPDMRYQSAAEMLRAFRNLYAGDRRNIRHKRRIVLSSIVLSLLFLVGGACTFTGLKQMESSKEALALAEYSSNYLAEGNVSEAVKLALQAIPDKKDIFKAPSAPQAQKALTDALGVYDLSDGFKSLDSLGIPSAPFGIETSPKGDCFAVLCQDEAIVFSMESQQEIVRLPLLHSALAELVFADEYTIIYAGDQGITVYDLNEGRVRWVGEEATALAVSGDGTVAAAVNRDEDRAVIYRVTDGSRIKECSFYGQRMPVPANDIFTNPQSSVFSLNRDGTMLAVSFSEGGLQIFDLTKPDNDLIIFDRSDYRFFSGGFCGKYFAFAANESAESLFGLVDTEAAEYIGGHSSPDPFLLTAEEAGIYLANGNLLVSFDPATLKETELAYAEDAKITGFSVGKDYVLLGTDGPGFSFYDRGANRMSSEACKENCDFLRISGKYAFLGNRNEPYVRMMKLENHEEALLLSYDARYSHDEARISRDGQTVMLFDYQQFRLYDRAGNVLAEVKLPDAEQIYDQQFRRSDKDSWLEVIWYDGTVRCYSAKDGSLLSEVTGMPPEKNLDEEFFTDQYRISSSLHKAPEVYDRETGRKIAVLEEDSYLTYVTQAGEYILTEYIRAAGERYGLLLDKNLQTLAYLPGLCDYADGMLIFDYTSGNLRQCPLYSLEELVEMGRAYQAQPREQ